MRSSLSWKSGKKPLCGSHWYILYIWGDCGVMVIVIGKGHVNSSSKIMNEFVCILQSANTLYDIILPPNRVAVMVPHPCQYIIEIFPMWSLSIKFFSFSIQILRSFEIIAFLWNILFYFTVVYISIGSLRFLERSVSAYVNTSVGWLLFVWWICYSPFCGVCLVDSLFPTIIVGALFEKANDVKDVKRRVQKNIQNKAVQTKLNLYIKKYMKKGTLQIFLFSLLNIPFCLCACVYTNTDIMEKRLNVESVLSTIKCRWTKYFHVI